MRPVPGQAASATMPAADTRRSHQHRVAGSHTIQARMRPGLTLSRVFLVMMAGLAAILGGLVYVLQSASRAAVADSAAALRDSASEQVRARVEAYLGQAETAVDAI